MIDFKLLKQRWAVLYILAILAQITLIVYYFNTKPVVAGQAACALLLNTVIFVIILIGRTYDDKHKSEDDRNPEVQASSKRVEPTAQEMRSTRINKLITLFIQAAMMAFVAGILSQPLREKNIHAQKFGIVDDKGRMRASFDCLEGSPRLVFMNTDARICGELSLADDTGDPSLILYDPAGNVRAKLAVGNSGAALTGSALNNSGASLVFLDVNGRIIKELPQRSSKGVSESH